MNKNRLVALAFLGFVAVTGCSSAAGRPADAAAAVGGQWACDLTADGTTCHGQPLTTADEGGVVYAWSSEECGDLSEFLSCGGYSASEAPPGVGVRVRQENVTCSHPGWSIELATWDLSPDGNALAIFEMGNNSSNGQFIVLDGNCVRTGPASAGSSSGGGGGSSGSSPECTHDSECGSCAQCLSGQCSQCPVGSQGICTC